MEKKVSKVKKREMYVLEKLSQYGKVSVVEMVKDLNQSEATIRRTFAKLEDEGKLIRTFSGAQQITPTKEDYSFPKFEKMNETEKSHIGFAAATYVENGESIYLDCGTTVMHMAKALNMRIDKGELSNVNIITNSIANLLAITPKNSCKIIMLGGEYQYERRDFSGILTERDLEMYHFRKCFLGCDGITDDSGFTTDHLALCSLNRLVLSKSAQSFILADHNKFGRTAFMPFCDIGGIDIIFTDNATDETYAARITANGPEIIRA